MSGCPMLHFTPMLATIALSELSITVSTERKTFLSNQCKIKMQYPYQISTSQLSLVTYRCHDFPEKHGGTSEYPANHALLKCAATAVRSPVVDE